jgi:hypothetical protein
MSYSLTPVVVDLRKVRKLMGSKDEAVLRAVFQKHHKELLNTDQTFDGDFDTFKKEIRAEYKAFLAGDYSGVDLAATYSDEPAGEGYLPGLDLEAIEAQYKRRKKIDPKAADKWLDEALSSDDDDVDDVEEAREPRRELSTGAALVHLILGGTPNPSVGFKYGYALFHLCLTLGDVPDHDAWCSIRSQTLDGVDAFLKAAGIKPKAFTVDKFLINRGPPVTMPRPDDFPSIGYLDRDEVTAVLAMLDPARLDPVLAAQSARKREWLREMTAELRSWLETCARTKLDLVCFYF